jgi:hypothetical protein
VVGIGVGACLLIGLATALSAFATGQNFTSWIGLGWFAVTAAVLVFLERKRGAS